MVTWADIASDGTESITYNGTEPTRPVFTVSFFGHASDYTITHPETGKFIRVERDFQPGDVMVVDCNAELVTVNGQRAMNDLDNFSDFLSVIRGDNNYEFYPVVAEVEIRYTPRWK